MSGKLNRYNLLDQEMTYLKELEEKTGSKFFSRLRRALQKNETLYYHFPIPTSYYLRAEIFCEDITSASDFIYTQADLIGDLINDFITQVRHQFDIHFITQKLIARDNRPAILRTYTGEQSIINLRENDMYKLRCTLKRNEALRIEMLLSEISEIYQDIHYFVEDIFQILYCDFVQTLKAGKGKVITKQILQNLKNEA